MFEMVEPWINLVIYGPVWPFFVLSEPIAFAFMLFGLMQAAAAYIPIVMLVLGSQALPNQAGVGSKKIAIAFFISGAVFATIGLTLFLFEPGSMPFLFLPHLLAGPALLVLAGVRKGAVRPSPRALIVIGVIITYLTTVPFVTALLLTTAR